MRYFFLLLLFLALLYGSAQALTEQELLEYQTEALDTRELEAYLPEGISMGTSFEDGLSRILNLVLSQLGSVFREAARSGAIVMVVALLMSLVGSIYTSSGGDLPDFIPLVGVLAVAGVAVGSSSAFIGLGADTLGQLDQFSSALLPAMAAAGTLSGAVTSAAVKYAGTVLFMDILMSISARVVMPLIYAFIATSIGAAALNSDGLRGTAKLLKWITGVLITTIMLSFVGYLTITGVVSGSADVVTTRIAKTTISAVLPVVGSIVADAAETVLAGAALVRNGIGVVGLLAVLSVCLIPILQLGAHYLIFKAASGLSSSLTDQRIGELIGDLGTAFGMVMGLTGAGAMMLFFSILSTMRMVIR